MQNKKEMIKVNPKIKKSGRIVLRSILLAVVSCVLIFGGIIVSDLLFSDNTEEVIPEIITVTVSGEEIVLGDDRKVTLSELSQYLDKAQTKGELYTVALINDTDYPADAELYNQIVDLLAKYDIICEKMKAPSTIDEHIPSSNDEIGTL